MKLSILDQSPIATDKTVQDALTASIELAVLADGLGYTRYWAAEHHDMAGLSSPAPDMMLAMIGQQTKSLRIGSGAVLLPHYKAFNIAERYNMLASLFPKRVDIGVGRAPGGSAEVTMALSDNFLENVRKMPDKLTELQMFLHGNFSKNHMYAKIAPSPVPVVPPDLWLLGTSEKSAILAAEKGTFYAFGHFMTSNNGPAIVEKYRRKYVGKNQPRVLVAISVICAETRAEAEQLALSSQLWKVQQAKEEANGVPSVEEAKAYPYSDEERGQIEAERRKTIIGNPQEVKRQLEELQEAYQTDEMMIVTITHSYEARKKSYQLLAKAFGLNG